MLSATFTFDSNFFKKRDQVAHVDSNLLDFEEYRKTLTSEIDDNRSRELFLELKKHDSLLWSTFTRQEMCTLAVDCFTVLKFKEGERIICEGEHATFFCVTLKGFMRVQLPEVVKITKTDEDGDAEQDSNADSKTTEEEPPATPSASKNEYDFLSMGKGAIIGEMAYFDIHNRYRTASIVSDGPSIVAIMSYAALQSMHDLDPLLQTKLMSLLGMTSLLKMRDNFQRYMSSSVKRMEEQLAEQKKAVAAATNAQQKKKKRPPKLTVDANAPASSGPSSRGSRVGNIKVKPRRFESLFMNRMKKQPSSSNPSSLHPSSPRAGGASTKHNQIGIVDEPVLQENYRKNVKDIRKEVELEFSLKYDGKLNNLKSENQKLVRDNLSLHMRNKAMDMISRMTQEKNHGLEKDLTDNRNRVAVLVEENKKIPELEFKIKQLQLRLNKMQGLLTIERKKAEGEAQVAHHRIVKTFLLMWRKHSRYVHYQIQLRRRDQTLSERTRMFSKAKDLYEEENKMLKTRVAVLEKDRASNRKIIKTLAVEKFVRVFQRKKQLTALYLTILSFCEKIMELNREHRGRDVQAYTLGAEEALEEKYRLISEKANLLDNKPSIETLFNVVEFAISSLEFDTTDLVRRLNTAAGAFLERNLSLCDEVERLRNEKGNMYEEACIEVQRQQAQLESLSAELDRANQEAQEAREELRRERGKQRIENGRKAKVEHWRAVKFAEFTQLAMGREVQTFDDVAQREQEAKMNAGTAPPRDGKMDFSATVPKETRVGFPVQRNKANVSGGLQLRLLEGSMTASNLMSHASLLPRKPHRGSSGRESPKDSKGRLTYDRAPSTSVNVARLRPKSALPSSSRSYRMPPSKPSRPRQGLRPRSGRAYDVGILNQNPRDLLRGRVRN